METKKEPKPRFGTWPCKTVTTASGELSIEKCDLEDAENFEVYIMDVNAEPVSSSFVADFYNPILAAMFVKMMNDQLDAGTIKPEDFEYSES